MLNSELLLTNLIQVCLSSSQMTRPVTESKLQNVVAHISRTLTPAEENYEQSKREALAIIYAAKKFLKYIYMAGNLHS